MKPFRLPPSAFRNNLAWALILFVWLSVTLAGCLLDWLAGAAAFVLIGTLILIFEAKNAPENYDDY